MNTLFKNVLIVALMYSLLLTWTPANANEMTRWDAFIFFASQYRDEVPESFQFIDLNYKDIDEDSAIWDALQILVYLDKIKNSYAPVYPDRVIDSKSLELLSAKLTKESPSEKPKITIRSSFNWPSGTTKQDVFDDVYTTLSNTHYDHEEFQKDQLLDGAIKGLAEGTGDKYTSYFPPVESKDFFQGLDGEYEWIGAYIDMTEPGVLMIVSPIVGSPAEQAGIRWGDRVTHVDGREISPENSQNEVISWIKGPAGSVVELTIIREWLTEELIIPVTRDKIIIKDIEHKQIDSSTYYIQIKNFWERVDTDFEDALLVVNDSSTIRKIVIDLRNNPGGYLDQVANLLSHVVPRESVTAIVSNGKQETPYISRWYETLNLSNYEVILLQNWGTASASEIMIGTLKDYFPKITVVWEQSFWKWSVQSLKRYYDGSTLKYTSAKWYTGKTKTAIDEIGITPDIEIEFDRELFENQSIDNQLQKALDL